MVKAPEPLKRFGSWKIFSGGDMENTELGYEITADRLNESDWWVSFLTEPKFDWNTFIHAYFYACKEAKVDILHIKMNFL
ncbi:hypothetical protein [Emticicia sp. 17c]|uniref:hypothetical protein n=1 Tax=Emticicia sp. 17c TaxID=3127704 RepID=UPI00301E4890